MSKTIMLLSIVFLYLTILQTGITCQDQFQSETTDILGDERNVDNDMPQRDPELLNEQDVQRRSTDQSVENDIDGEVSLRARRDVEEDGVRVQRPVRSYERQGAGPGGRRHGRRYHRNKRTECAHSRKLRRIRRREQMEKQWAIDRLARSLMSKFEELEAERVLSQKVDVKNLASKSQQAQQEETDNSITQSSIPIFIAKNKDIISDNVNKVLVDIKSKRISQLREEDDIKMTDNAGHVKEYIANEQLEDVRYNTKQMVTDQQGRVEKMRGSNGRQTVGSKKNMRVLSTRGRIMNTQEDKKSKALRYNENQMYDSSAPKLSMRRHESVVMLNTPKHQSNVDRFDIPKASHKHLGKILRSKPEFTRFAKRDTDITAEDDDIDVKTTPETILTTPEEILATREDILTTPEVSLTTTETDLLITPETITSTSDDMLTNSEDILTTQQTILTTSEDNLTTPEDILTTPEDISTTTIETSNMESTSTEDFSSENKASDQEISP